MFIDQIFPAVVAEKSTLLERLIAEAMAQGVTREQASAILSIVPERLISAGCFLDKMTGLWRYEFGVPYDIAKDLVWGTHMWVPVDYLYAALFCVYSRLPREKRAAYLGRLADPDAHQATLVEMIPAHKVDPAVPIEFEVAGLGAGNRTVDWAIGPQGGRTVLLDVKRRTTDFIKQAERIGAEGAAPEPDHDPLLLFRSVEQKFVSANPDSCLQGIWIVTDIKQDEEQLRRAFSALDASKVHFAILGDWKPDVYVLGRRDEDRQYLLDLFRAEPSTRFTFTIDNEG